MERHWHIATSDGGALAHAALAYAGGDAVAVAIAGDGAAKLLREYDEFLSGR